MKPIAVWYHCLFELGTPPQFLPNAFEIVAHQMADLVDTGLLNAADHFVVGINGGKDSDELANLVIPARAKRLLHGLQCRNECRTVLAMQLWAQDNPGWHVLYFHAKGSVSLSMPPDQSRIWRECMMRHVIRNWRQCVADLEAHDVAGCHYMHPPQTPAGQHIMAGGFYWVTSDFLRTLPLLALRDRIKVSGIDALESRFEAEVILGFGPRLPRVKDYHPNWNPSLIATCIETKKNL